MLLGVLTGACSSGKSSDAVIAAAKRPAPAVIELDAGANPDSAAPDGPRDTLLGEFRLTYYWMANEGKGAGKRDVQLYTRECKPLANVSEAFAARLEREGTGKLRDGRTINVSGTCDCERSPCFFTVSRKKRWGVGVAYRPLSPFRSVAVDPDVVPIGTTLYVPEFDGLTVPGRKPWGGFIHDGCVVADDTGGGITGNQIDLFMARKLHYQAFDRRHRIKRITVYSGTGRCEHDGDTVVRVNRNST